MNINMDSISALVDYAPFLAITGSLCYPKKLRLNDTTIFYIAVIHNTFLIAFSGWTFVSLWNVIEKYGLVFKSGYYFQHKDFDRIMFYFYLSKYYEFFDTFLLYMKGKNPILLQKYHHIGAVLSWHFTYVNKIDCIWIPSFANSLIHTIMYSYYLGCLLKIKQVRFIKQYLTSMQLVQLVGTMTLCNYYYTPPNESMKNYSYIWFVNIYNTLLIFLFMDFYKKAYLVQKKT